MAPATQSPEQLLDHLTTGVMVLDGDLTICYLNPAAEAMLGRSGRQSAGLRFDEVILDTQQLCTRLHTALESGQPYTERHSTLTLPESVEIATDYTVTPMADRRGLVVELQALNRLLLIDSDERAVAQQETTRKLLRGLAHEVKNPLGGIRGAAQLLASELPSDALKEYTDVIIAEADRLRDLVDRMLGPNTRPKIESVNIHKVTERVIALVVAERRTTGAGERAQPDVRIRRDYDPSAPDVEADEDQLVQALLNIVQNAMQALEHTPAPEVRIVTRIVRQYTIGTMRHRMVLKLDVIDNGPGIPDDLIERMYFPMISGRAEGTGLGLAITQSIISQHHGFLKCETRSGRTCFSIFLPLQQKAADQDGTHPRGQP